MLLLGIWTQGWLNNGHQHAIEWLLGICCSASAQRDLKMDIASMGNDMSLNGCLAFLGNEYDLINPDAPTVTAIIV